MRKVFIVLHAPHRGGPHIIIERIAKQLHDFGWDQYCVVPLGDDGSIKHFQEVGVNVSNIPLRRIRRTLNPLSQLEFILTLPIDIFRIWKLIRRIDPDVVQIVGLLHFQASIAALLAGKPIVWQLHGSLPPAFLRRLIMIWISLVADVLMASGTETVNSHPGAKKFSNRLFTFMAPVDSDIFSPNVKNRQFYRDLLGIPKTAVLVGTVGNRVWVKRHDLFVEVARRIKEQFENTYFRIVGAFVSANSQNYFLSVVRNARVKGLLDNGFLDLVDPGNNVPGYMRAMDIFLITSMKEGTSLVTQEAMATGIPVVGFAAGSLTDSIINGETGFLVPSQNISEMCRCVSELIEKPDLRRKLGRNGRKRVIKLSTTKNCAKIHQEAYMKALDVYREKQERYP